MLRRAHPVTRLVVLAAAALGVLVSLFAFGGSSAAQEQPSAPDPGAESPPSTTAPGSTRIVASLTVGEDREPVEGVVITVSLDGEEVGRAESGDDGVASVAVPGAGKYEVSLDRASLPDDVVLARGAPDEISPRVRDGVDRSVIFRLDAKGAKGASPTRAESSTTERVASLLASGIRLGLVIALGAVGLSLIFGTTGLTNFAHGELLAFGAIVAWYLNSPTGGLGLPLILAALGAVLATSAFGASFELAVYKPLRRRGMPVVSQMVVSIGLAFAFRYLFSAVYGSSTKQYSQFAAQAPSLQFGPIAMRPKDLVISVLAAAALVAVGLFLQRSRLGTAIRAVSDNRDLSVASGIDDKRVVLLVWSISGALAGLAGVMLGSSEAVGYSMGQRVLLIMFAAVLLGGLGTTFGAMFGGLFVGIVSDLSTLWLDADLKIVVALATLIAVLLFRPQGVFGVRARTA